MCFLMWFGYAPHSSCWLLTEVETQQSRVGHKSIVTVQFVIFIEEVVVAAVTVVMSVVVVVAAVVASNSAIQ